MDKLARAELQQMNIKLNRRPWWFKPWFSWEEYRKLWNHAAACQLELEDLRAELDLDD
jgi:hypothetical protein